MGVVVNDICHFCLHTKSCWVRFVMYLKVNSFSCARFSVNPTLILFGHDGNAKTGEGFDFILLHAKSFVYKCRLEKKNLAYT